MGWILNANKKGLSFQGKIYFKSPILLSSRRGKFQVQEGAFCLPVLSSSSRHSSARLFEASSLHWRSDAYTSHRHGFLARFLHSICELWEGWAFKTNLSTNISLRCLFIPSWGSKARGEQLHLAVPLLWLPVNLASYSNILQRKKSKYTCKMDKLTWKDCGSFETFFLVWLRIPPWIQ